MDKTYRVLKSAAFAAGLGLSSIGAASGGSNFGLNFVAPQGSTNAEVLGLGPTFGWAQPSIFNSRRFEKGAKLSLTQYYASLSSRTLEGQEGLLSFSPDEKLMVWYAKQTFLAKGRFASSRFRVDIDTYGARYIINEPDEAGLGGTAVQLEFFRPGTASVRTAGGNVDYFATKNVAVSAMHNDDHNDYLLSFTDVRGAGSGKGQALDAGAGRTFTPKENLDARLEGHLVGESLKGNGLNVSLEVRPVLYGALSYHAASWLSIEGDVSVMPAGMPIAGGRLTGLTSFQIYNPGGPAQGLRTNFVALASLRLLGHWRF
jgi:hypothetical protein